MSSQPAISISYSLQPPTNTTPPESGTPTTLDQTIPLPGSSQNTKAYYSSLSEAVLSAQATLNQHLTAWKDAIGDAEKPKEDMGKVGFGKGKTARMLMADKAAQAQSGISAEGGEGAEQDDEDDTDEE